MIQKIKYRYLRNNENNKLKIGIKYNSQTMRYGFIGYALALLLFLLFAQDGYSITSRIVAWLILVFGSMPFLVFISKRNNRLPFIELIMLAYVNAYSLPIFFESENMLLVKILYPDSEPVTACLLLALLAIFALWLGFMITPALLRPIRPPKLTLHCDNGKLFYFGVLLCLLSVVSSSFDFGDLDVLIGLVASSTLGIALIAFLYFKQALSKRKMILSILILLILILKGVTTSMTQAILQPLLIWFLCRWLVTKKFELHLVLLGVALFVLLQPVKLQFRDLAWNDAGQSASAIEKIALFADIFYNHWFLTGSGDKLEESVTTRTSLLLQTAHVIDWTPDVVPFKNGETLQFMLVTWVPRFIWHNKPIAQQGNIDFAIDYGVTTVLGTETTMFGVGQLGEIFINFGAIGVFPMFILLGIFSYLPIYFISIPKVMQLKQCAQRNDFTVAPMALLVSVLFKFIIIGSAIADSYGGMLQQILVQGGMLYLFTRSRRSVLGTS